MKKSWLRFLLEILIGLFTLVLFLALLLQYFKVLYMDDEDVVITKLLNIKWDVFFPSFTASLFFSTSVYVVPYFVIKQGITRELLNPMVKEESEGILAKLSIAVFILLLSITGLNESQFSLFTGVLAFITLLRTSFFKK